jgi:hypothetical protein
MYYLSKNNVPQAYVVGVRISVGKGETEQKGLRKIIVVCGVVGAGTVVRPVEKMVGSV